MKGKVKENDDPLFGEYYRAQEREQGGPQYHGDAGSTLSRLSHSAFRSRFYLNEKEKEYVRSRGMDVIRQHAEKIIERRLAPAVIPGDGKQTPMRHGSHPVFLAQHATACCCRGCLSKWHHIPPGRALSSSEKDFVLSLICEWIRRQAY